MPNFKHILFPVDFSERCSGALPFVVAMARVEDLGLFLGDTRSHTGREAGAATLTMGSPCFDSTASTSFFISREAS